ncbi:MAG: BON domain-containing protein [Bryobacteraceae bacterium]
MHRRSLLSILLPVALLAQGPSDDALYDLVRRKLASDPQVKGGQIQVDVKQGVVTLRGPIATGKQKERAEKVARKVKGVKQVVNELRVQ